ncbi:hypothetical protein ACFPM7_12035 [Actinokineospora guangxiensis]|uniref:Uncharacterized protein n=1 Tax=Actinokineospora guangxiensis TaxID=1490288 RepID=A0ABW0ELP5_9PSEU
MRALAVAAVLFLVGVPLAGAQTAAPVEVVDAGTPVVLSGEPEPVRLLNTTGRALSVGVAATARSADRSEVGIEVRQGDSVVSAVEVGPGGDVWLSLDLVGAAPTEAISGYFVATADQVAVRRPITVRAAEAAAIVPSVESWEVDWAPLLPSSDARPLPGRVPSTACPDGAERSAPVVSGHDTATVTARCAGGALVLDLSGVPSGWPSLGTGEYAGTLEFGDKKLAVSVGVSSSVVAALGWLLAGIVAAIAGTTYAADRSPYNGRRNAIRAIQEPGDGPLRDRVSVAKRKLTDELADTRPKLPRRLLPWPEGRHADRLTAVDTDTKRLREAAALTGPYEDGARALAANGPALATRFPGMAERFAALLDPPPDLTAAALADLVADTAAIPALLALVADLERMRGVVAETAPRSRARHEARLRLNQLVAALGRLERPTEVAGLRADVAETTALVDRLVEVGPLPRGELGVREMALPGKAFDVVRAVFDGIGDIVAGTGKTAMVVRDAAAAVVAAVVALWSGFAALYVTADTWGSLWDVLAAVTWGAAATAVSGPLLTAIRRVGSSRQPGD